MNANDSIKKFEPLWGNWITTELLGEGGYGRVYKAIRKDDPQYVSAIKHITIPQNASELQEAQQLGMDEQSVYAYFGDMVKSINKEIEIIYNLRGDPYIVAYEDHQLIHTPNTLKHDIFIRMELLIPLSAFIANNPLSPEDVCRMGIEICSALETCVAYNIIHRDIKEGNIFLNSRGTFKLGDFGIARELSSASRGMSMRGTPAYVAPEVYNGRNYDATVDIYSLGILMYKLLNGGRYPFLPAAPQPITMDDTDAAFAKRMRGETPPPPASGNHILKAAVMMACDFFSEERFQNATAFRSALSKAQAFNM